MSVSTSSICLLKSPIFNRLSLIQTMAKYTLKINQQQYTVEAEPQTPLLWVIRDEVGLTGTKFGCGIAQCGACTVHLNGTPVRSCVLPVSATVDQNITTIEGLSDDNSHPVQKAWLEVQAPQCGYCQSGQIMSATALLNSNPKPSDDDIDAAMSGNICRCGTYPRIRKAIHLASKEMTNGSK
jgi:isoquinoline 1-oxidoreductase alpha subunit